jgi:hypothetical protein
LCPGAPKKQKTKHKKAQKNTKKQTQENQHFFGKNEAQAA